MTEKPNMNQMTNQNKTSMLDSRQNMGAVGAMNSRQNPNMGTHKFDYKDNVKGKEGQRAYKAKYSSGNSDAKKSAGLPHGTARHK